MEMLEINRETEQVHLLVEVNLNAATSVTANSLKSPTIRLVRKDFAYRRGSAWLRYSGVAGRARETTLANAADPRCTLRCTIRGWVFRVGAPDGSPAPQR